MSLCWCLLSWAGLSSGCVCKSQPGSAGHSPGMRECSRSEPGAANTKVMAAISTWTFPEQLDLVILVDHSVIRVCVIRNLQLDHHRSCGAEHRQQLQLLTASSLNKNQLMFVCQDWHKGRCLGCLCLCLSHAKGRGRFSMSPTHRCQTGKGCLPCALFPSALSACAGLDLMLSGLCLELNLFC